MAGFAEKNQGVRQITDPFRHLIENGDVEKGQIGLKLPPDHANVLRTPVPCGGKNYRRIVIGKSAVKERQDSNSMAALNAQRQKHQRILLGINHGHE
jgi:hypothetical protein